MPLRPDFNLTRRPTAPVKLPRMTFPMVGGPVEQFQPMEQAEGALPEPAATPPVAQQEPAPKSEVSSQSQGPAAAAQREATRVIVYGRSGCDVCLEAVQDLIDRQMSFVYYDVITDPGAMEHLKAISAGRPVVPVIIQIGFGGTRVV
jgi:glutaredoxin